MRKTKIFLVTAFLFLVANTVLGQNKNVTGTVTSKTDGTALPGVSVTIKGTTRGVETDFDGKYSIKTKVGDVLLFSYLGTKSQSFTVGSSSVINVALEEDASQLEEIVVTALGIKKTRKSLTYAAQDIKAEELNRVKQTNPLNSLSGKVSGVTISRSASGAGGSVKVVLRGNSSLGSNQPLYVINGVPLSNPTATQPTSTFGAFDGGNRDGGDALSLINPDDIESLTVLKGASASALYGSAGLNGVILITTKKGKSGSYRVSYSSNLTIDKAAYFMDFNDTALKNVNDFFQTGTTAINAVSVSGGSDTAQTYFSYSNTNSTGILPTNTMNQHTFNVRETMNMFDNKLKVNASVMASSQKVHNRPVSGLYFNPLVGVYNFESTTETLADYKTFEEYDAARNIMAQRWFRGTSDIEQNPYWMIHRNASDDTNQKLVSSLTLNYKLKDWISLQARGTYDVSKMGFEKKIFATTEATLAPLTGRYIVKDNSVTKLFGDLIATINTKVNDNISITGLVGVSSSNTKQESFIGDSGVSGGLTYANVFSFQNFNGGSSANFSQNSLEIQEYSVFSSATISFEDKLYVDLTARNDWSSTLPNGNNSFFYPSIGMTAILDKYIDFGKSVSFAKVRASYAEVGHPFGADLVSPYNNIAFGGGGVTPSVGAVPGTIPKPERQKSFEIGTEWKFNNNKYGFDIGYYNTNTVNQYFFVEVNATVFGVPNAYLNAGEIVNNGIEFSAFAKLYDTDDFTWVSRINYAKNNNKINKLIETNIDGIISLNSFAIDDPGATNTFGSYLTVGGSFGDIYGKVVKKVEGLPEVELNPDGTVLKIMQQDDDIVPNLDFIGNSNPDFTLGWNNSFNYKNFSFDFLIDGKFGGKVVSMTEAVVEGKSNNSARETANGKVDVITTAGVKTQVDATDYYGKLGGRTGFTGEYTYDATNIRLSEMAIGYNFNLSEDSFFKSIKASFVGSNLFFFYKVAPYDPNITLSTGNNLQGVDVLGLPSTRSYGLNINLSF